MLCIHENIFIMFCYFIFIYTKTYRYVQYNSECLIYQYSVQETTTQRREKIDTNILVKLSSFENDDTSTWRVVLILRL